MTIEQTYVDGVVTSETTKTPTLTVSFTKKVGKPNYGNEEVSVFSQVDLPLESTLEDIETLAKERITLLKGIVFNELGLMSAVDQSSGTLQAVEAQAAPAAPKPTYSRPQGAAARPAYNGTDDDLWRELQSNPSAFYDNAEKKASGQYKQTAADFTHKATRKGLWLKSKPAWFEEVI